MNDKTKTTNVGAAGSLFRVGYTYAAKNGQLRAGAIIVEAKDAQEANKTAADRLASFGLTHARVTNTREY